MPVSTSRDPARIAGMFDAIAGRYDALNHLLSGGLDRRWRRRAVRELGLTGRERVLDVCAGTADLAIEAATASAGHARTVVGVDFAGEMLRIAKAKVRDRVLDARLFLARADATALPFASGAFDAAMIAFGIRNVLDPARAAAECHRVLRPGAPLAILEFGLPTTPGLRAIYAAYFRRALPRIGRLVSRHGDAYSYLPASVHEFPPPEVFAALLARAGFIAIRHVPLTCGVVSLYIARRG
jgi:demethylmenaquinone methyltransferase/2-methoxy-6-polyprenyl-1,4-benzoquinol methylase